MSTVFLIGNGFDLSCGMKTRYKDVYDSYRTIHSTDSKLIQNFKQNISSNYDKWCDFEKGMAEYAKELRNENEFVECIKNFRDFLHFYLQQEDIKFENFLNRNEKSKSMLIQNIRKDVLESYYTGITPHITNIVKGINNNSIVGETNFISFNYTSSFDKLMHLALGIKEIFHIHGKLDSYMIMGMDNEKQITPNYELTERGKQAFIKPYFNNIYDENQTVKGIRLIEGADIICVFGLSLGESDLTWRKAIIDSLQRGSHHLFLFDYELSCKQTLLLNDKLDLEVSKRNAILKFWGVQNPDFYSDKIHIPCGQKLFDIETIIKNGAAE